MSTRLALVGLALAAALFGGTFVVVKDALAAIPPMGFVAWRFLLASAALFLVARPSGTRVWRDGLVAGSLLFAGYAFQTAGLVTTTASNSGLITGLYVVFTPLLAGALVRRAPSWITLAGTALALVGLVLLTVEPPLRFERGDLLTLACAVAFAAHIVALSRLAPRHPVLPFTAVQLLVTAVAALGLAAVFEGLTLPPREVLWALLLTGVGVSVAAFALQVHAQRVVGPSRTAIVLAVEPVFAAAIGAVVLGERLDAAGWVGAAAIMAGIYLVLTLSPDDELLGAEAITEAH